ncbi:hypothetical protein EST38_g1757 [Candolleomyces aberdarensis]|uniref:F-box domain-containing protein n=1 Tax=Candolleomyces aberdarensis TaxID=2316362 RepID=A0A4Q2DUJ7_9AGAR|nr:hypothetical protein EST38_g1757 [Candolleomyces aberdarensis]
METESYLLSHLLNTNAVPERFEVASIQLGIHFVQNTLSQLQRQTRELEGQLRQFHSVLSPARRLPVEILGEIFSSAISHPLDETERKRLVNFALVCRTWHNAVYHAHRLWNSIRIPGELTESSYEFILSCFSRSGGIPRLLEIGRSKFKAHDGCGESNSECSSGSGTLLLAKLLTEGPTLRTLCIHFDRLDCFRNLLAAFQFFKLKDSAPRPWDSIRSLALHFKWKWNEHPNPANSIFLSIPSTVTELQLYLPDFFAVARGWGSHDSASENAPLHLNQDLLGRLSSFLLSCDWKGARLLAHLPYCTAVETLTLDFKHMPMRYDQSDEFVRRIPDIGILLPKVHTLSLQNTLIEGLNILQFLNTPSLIRLDIDFTREDEVSTYRFAKRVEAFIKHRSQCEGTFRSLALHHAATKTEDLAYLLTNLPSLTHVTLDDVSFKSTLFETLRSSRINLRPGRSISLPHLETLELLDLPYTFDPYYLVQFLMKRKGYDAGSVPPILRYPFDSIKRLVVTYKQAKLSDGLGGREEIELLRNNTDMSLSIGPLLYSM